jgi:rhamnogalacturonan endolyase
MRSQLAIRGLTLLALLGASAADVNAQRQMERLGRGLIAMRIDATSVYLGWRLLGTDPQDVAFNLYRSSAGAEPVRLNTEPLTKSTDFVDRGADLNKSNAWFVRPVIDGKEFDERSRAADDACALPAAAAVRAYLAIPLQTPPGCTPNDASVGDLDGDGQYEIVLKQEMRGRDNSQAGATGQTKLEAYKLDGTLLWRIDLGRNIREGAHYTQFMVYDLDGDGRAEVACKTADGALDGEGKPIGDAAADHRNERGYVLEGPEFLTVFDGRTGAALATVDYLPPRGDVRSWGDDYGNRVDRFLACVAYLDGKRPSLVMCRGYYTRTVLAAWNWRDGKLSHVWTFDSHAGPRENRDYTGQGNHSLCVADVDGDGRDEIVYGACCIDDDGTGLYSTGLGHGDALHVSDLDPARAGLEAFDIHERPRHAYGIELRDAANGKVLWGAPSPDVGRGLALDVDPRHRGFECWASGSGLESLFNCRGEKIGPKPRSCNMGVWWDADPLRELLDGTTIDKWDYENGRSVRLVSAHELDCASNNGTKANPCLCADILGDWREEVLWRTRDGRELRIFSTTIPATNRQYTLMHDPVYRLGIAWQNVGYNQPAHPGFFLGDGMAPPPRPNIFVAAAARPGEGKDSTRAADDSLDRALAFLAREVPKWSVENKCYSCHNNGDAARALYTAASDGFKLNEKTLADTTAWLVKPDAWQHNGGEGEFNDRKLAAIQFAHALLFAVETGAVRDRAPLAKAAELVAGFQGADGSWTIDPKGSHGAPATYGGPLATAVSLRVLSAADANRHKERIENAGRWLREFRAQSVVDTAAVLIGLGDDSDDAAKVQRRRYIDHLKEAQVGSGGWGPFAASPPEPFDTAIALLALAQAGEFEAKQDMIVRGRRYLLESQLSDGSWLETTRPARAVSYAERISTAGWATLALLATK